MRWRCPPRAMRTGASPTCRRCTARRSDAAMRRDLAGAGSARLDLARAGQPAGVPGRPFRAGIVRSAPRGRDHRRTTCGSGGGVQPGARRASGPVRRLPDRAVHGSQYRLVAGRRADRAGAQPSRGQTRASSVRQHACRRGELSPGAGGGGGGQRLHVDRRLRLAARGRLSHQRGGGDCRGGECSRSPRAAAA